MSPLMFVALLALGLLAGANGQAQLPKLPFAVPQSFGPTLRLSSSDDSKHVVTVLVGVYATPADAKKSLRLSLTPTNGVSLGAGKLVAEHHGWTLMRWQVTLPVRSSQQVFKYRVRTLDAAGVPLLPVVTQQYTITVPGRAAGDWNIAYYSCNGFHDPKTAPPSGIEPLWSDLVAQHNSGKPLHLIVGDGDQLYNDGVLDEVPELRALVEAKTPAPALAFKWTDNVTMAASDWLFSHYAFWWSSSNSKSYARALASVPFVMSWDDHEAFNGWGSQPADLMKSELFAGYYEIAKKWYLAFQHHSSPSDLMPDLKWGQAAGGKGFQWSSALGKDTYLLVVDERAERTQDQVLSPATYKAVQARLDAAPSTVKHLVVASANPLIYSLGSTAQRVVFSQINMTQFGYNSTFRDLQKLLETPTGQKFLGAAIGASFGNQFGYLDVSDIIDMLDSADGHLAERGYLVNMMQAWAAPRGVRVTYLGGDSHLPYAGNFFSVGYKGAKENDPNYALSITSSAIGNNPAAGLLSLGLEAASAVFVEPIDASNKISSSMIPVWKGVSKLVNATWNYNYYLPARNWLRLQVNPQDESLGITWRLEAYTNGTLAPVSASLVAPKYTPVKTREL